MAYSVTDFHLTNEIQFQLMETANNGASYASGLYTSTEVSARLNYRLRDFYKRTNIVLTFNGTDYKTTADITTQNMPPDVIDLVNIDFPNSNGTIYVVPKGSAVEADLYMDTPFSTSVDVPSIFSLDTGPPLQMDLYPPPSASRTLGIVYIAQPTSLPATPDGTLIECPDDFAPYIKYGALADLFRKSGETYDPARAELCEKLYQLGTSIAALWVSGENTKL